VVGRRLLASGAMDGKLWRCQITKHACLSHVLVSCQTRPTDCCHLRLITFCGCNCPTMYSPSHTDRLGRVYSLEWFSKSWSVTDVALIRRQIQPACSLLNDAMPARPTDPSHVASGPPLPSPVDLLAARLPTRSLVASKWICVSTVVKQSWLVDRRSSCLLHCLFLTARNSMLDTENFFRVSSLASLVNIPNMTCAKNCLQHRLWWKSSICQKTKLHCVQKKNTHLRFLLYLRGKCLDSHKIFRVRYVNAKGPASRCLMHGFWYWRLNWHYRPQTVLSHHWSQSLSIPIPSTSTYSTSVLQPPKKTKWLWSSSHWI